MVFRFRWMQMFADRMPAFRRCVSSFNRAAFVLKCFLCVIVFFVCVNAQKPLHAYTYTLPKKKNYLYLAAKLIDHCSQWWLCHNSWPINTNQQILTHRGLKLFEWSLMEYFSCLYLSFLNTWIDRCTIVVSEQFRIFQISYYI